MSIRKLIIEIDAEDKYCCRLWIKSRLSADLFYCPVFEEHLKMELNCIKNARKLLRCQACLDAEVKK